MTHRDRAVSAALSIAGTSLLLALLGCPARNHAADTQPPRAAPPATATGAGQVTSARGGAEVEWTLSSTAFAEGERVPAVYTGDGTDISPPLSWDPAPESTLELVLICDDPDAPAGIWTHWVLYGLSPDVTSLDEGMSTGDAVDRPSAMQGANSWGNTGYRGPAPPPGKPHRYQFTLYAVDEALDLAPGAARDEVIAAIEGKVIAHATLEGTYER